LSAVLFILPSKGELLFPRQYFPVRFPPCLRATLTTPRTPWYVPSFFFSFLRSPDPSPAFRFTSSFPRFPGVQPLRIGLFPFPPPTSSVTTFFFSDSFLLPLRTFPFYLFFSFRVLCTISFFFSVCFLFLRPLVIFFLVFFPLSLDRRGNMCCSPY